MTPTLQKIASATSTGSGSTTTSILSPKSVLKRRYDFHGAVEKLVQEKFVPSSASSPTGTTTAAPSSVLPNGLDTSSESGYGSDQDSLNSQTNQVQNPIAPEQAINKSSPGTNPSLPPPPPALPPRKKAQRKQVKFDSYVMLLQ